MIRRFSQWFIYLAAIIIFLVAVFYIHHQIQAEVNRPSPVKTVTEQHPNVSVISVEACSHEAKVTAYGAASPHFKLSLTAQVAGQVEALAPAFEPGKRIKKGDLLARLEDCDYQAAVAAVQKDLNDARLSLLEEQRKGLQAKVEWASSGVSGEPESELVLREPQLAAAQAAVANAEAALISARKDLRQTRITAPFDALVVERCISPGSYLQAGSEIATLYSTDRVEIAVSLSAEQWAKLPETFLPNSGQWPVELTDVQNGRRWSGRVLRAEQHMNESIRQRSLILAVDSPLDSDPALLPGTFVKATISGRSLDNLWKLPSSALSQKGEIWYVTDNNTLDCFSATLQFSDADAIYISTPDSLSAGDRKVLVHPLTSYLQGMAVNPVEDPDHER
ncbi:MAG: efflux RND transporter periplasmic adaptor subunit [Desulfobacteraceae bacterium]|nr:MAG: efflux RND transporter periplasmic adaptor subunit [Desulfobacteraceae bacterium]